MRAVLAGCLVLAGAVAEAAEIRARFVGNMAFQLTDGRVTLRTDFPYESGYSGYMTWSDALVPAAAGDALCLVTHSHRDHFLASLAQRFCQKLVGPAEVTAALPGRGLEMIYHHQMGESVPEVQGRELPRQGDELVFRRD